MSLVISPSTAFLLTILHFKSLITRRRRAKVCEAYHLFIIMWDSYITREYLLWKISLLAILESVQDYPKQHVLILPLGWRFSLTIKQEREIVNNLAFFLPRLKNSKRVIVIGIKEDHDGQGMVIRMAINGGNNDVPCAKDGLKQISRILETSRQEQSEAENTTILLRLVADDGVEDVPKCEHRANSP
ncbi:hypothetical protein BKA65DRAFT_474261 [Rhexocercosporidium sp. MPI-PUGE-AT-0058]|nr:hypothetical protein BKA65DRAFT_474261 [Rhexocercosporidium sp. MPI-PUGE-AT-0058]